MRVGEGGGRRGGMVPNWVGRVLLQEPASKSRPEAVLDPDVRCDDRLRRGHALPGALLPLQVPLVAAAAAVVVAQDNPRLEPLLNFQVEQYPNPPNVPDSTSRSTRDYRHALKRTFHVPYPT